MRRSTQSKMTTSKPCPEDFEGIAPSEPKEQETENKNLTVEEFNKLNLSNHDDSNDEGKE